VSTLLGFATVLEPSLLRSLLRISAARGSEFSDPSGSRSARLAPLFGAAAERGFFDEGFTILAVFAAGMFLPAFRIPEN